MPLQRVKFDKKNYNVHFFFSTKRIPEETEYIVSAASIQDILDHIINGSEMIEKRIYSRAKNKAEKGK